MLLVVFLAKEEQFQGEGCLQSLPNKNDTVAAVTFILIKQFTNTPLLIFTQLQESRDICKVDEGRIGDVELK